MELEERMRPPLSPDFNRKRRFNQEIWGQQRLEVQTFPVVTTIPHNVKLKFNLYNNKR
ncbi:hypothetical protein PRIO_6243 [Paenibacillus riograndensis SBR5]|uniref:Uncharacterized protein n=1 Tax=Paenibacillus riograndensis SBR5 TaxID=1073571 RepID=A0A0E4HDW2_9BACL|nr:hypothetical protein PRIO_6243 [Paenibacillus riograndensis SBR5]